jgi:hypothetical protein
MKEEWLFPNAAVPVDTQTTLALLVEIKRLIDVVGSMALAKPLEHRNFCSRCGKRRGGDVNYMHTCTLSKENTNG